MGMWCWISKGMLLSVGGTWMLGFLWLLVVGWRRKRMSSRCFLCPVLRAMVMRFLGIGIFQ